MKRVMGFYNGAFVVLKEPVNLAPNTEVEVFIPESGDKSLIEMLDELDKKAAEEGLSADEIDALVHEARKTRPKQEAKKRLNDAFGKVGENAVESDVEFALPAQREVIGADES